MMRGAVLLLIAAAVLAGCGSKKHTAATTAPLHVLPNAQTPDEWAFRIVNRFLRPLNKDLGVVTGFNNPQIRLFIASKNPTTLNIIDVRMHDLERCTAKLIEIGPPPTGHRKLTDISFHFRRACTDYEDVARTLLKATKFLSSGRTDVAAKGEDIARSARDASGRASNNFVAGVRIAQSLPEFVRAGLKPSV